MTGQREGLANDWKTGISAPVVAVGVFDAEVRPAEASDHENATGQKQNRHSGN